MTSTGALLMVLAPSDRSLTALTWVWPPLVLALAGWTCVHMRRDLSGPGRWLVATTMVLLAAASVGAARERGHGVLREHLSRSGHDPLRG